jgi:ribosomal protein S18 acetylase RimI-like enzyme
MTKANVGGQMAGAAAAPRAAETYVVRRLEDQDTIRRLLEGRPAYSAYALGQLEPDLFPLSRWWLAEGTGGRALLLHSRGGLGNALFALGDAAALTAALSLHPGPRSAFATCQTEHLQVVRRFFHLSQEHPLLRMKVTPATFRPTQGEARRLLSRDARFVNRLCNAEGVVASYTGRQIAGGVYFGAYVGEQLVAVAGTHAVSPTHGVAVVGNVYTHPRYRGQGLGALVTGAVTANVIESCPLVVLSVDPRNQTAVRAYQHLGYEEESRLIEASASRKDIVGLRSLVRRFLAARRGGRGRPLGGALVRL